MVQLTKPKSHQELTDEIEASTFFTYAENISQLRQTIERFKTQHPTDKDLVFYALNKMLKYNSKFSLKAKKLRGILEQGKTSKRHYYYDAEPWDKWCQRHNESRLIPQLALKLYQLEKENKLNE